MPSNYPLDLYRGDTFRCQFRLWQDAAKTIPVNLVGVTVKSEIHAQSDNVLIASFTCSITSPNIIDLLLPASESKKLTSPPARWDLQLTLTNGDVQTPIAGTVTVQLDATI